MTQTPSFRTVLRGYDPSEVDQRLPRSPRPSVAARQEAADRTVELTQLRQGNTRLKEALSGAGEASARSSRTPSTGPLRPPSATSASGSGASSALADEEADEIRRTAAEDAKGLRGSATAEVDEQRRSAERYATEVRGSAEADAARVVGEGPPAGRRDPRRRRPRGLRPPRRARRSTRTSARGCRGRRRLRGHAGRASRERCRGVREPDGRPPAGTGRGGAAGCRAGRPSPRPPTARPAPRPTALLDSARQEAETLVAAAREKAERIRRDSERELAAATARRDSITAQLSNVRQMLSTLGGAPMVEHLVGAADEAGSPETAAAQHEKPADAGSAAQDAAAAPQDKGDRRQAGGREGGRGVGHGRGHSDGEPGRQAVRRGEGRPAEAQRRRLQGPRGQGELEARYALSEPAGGTRPGRVLWGT